MLKLCRTGAPCAIPDLGRGLENPIQTGEVVEIPDRFAASFVLPDGTPDVGWAVPVDVHDPSPVTITERAPEAFEEI